MEQSTGFSLLFLASSLSFSHLLFFCSFRRHHLCSFKLVFSLSLSPSLSFSLLTLSQGSPSGKFRRYNQVNFSSYSSFFSFFIFSSSFSSSLSFSSCATTYSINHNWLNGGNIYQVWQFLEKELVAIEAELDDLKPCCPKVFFFFFLIVFIPSHSPSHPPSPLLLQKLKSTKKRKKIGGGSVKK